MEVVSSAVNSLTPLRSVLDLFLQYVYVLRNCVRSVVHHLLAYGVGLAFGVSEFTADDTTSMATVLLSR